MDIIALRPVAYAGKKYNRGDTIPAKPRDAKILMAIGKAAPKPVSTQSSSMEVLAPEKTVQIPSLPAAIQPPAIIEEKSSETDPKSVEIDQNSAEISEKTEEKPEDKRPRRYKTRDMKADE